MTHTIDCRCCIKCGRSVLPEAQHECPPCTDSRRLLKRRNKFVKNRRTLLAKDMREEGKTFREIAEELSIEDWRAREAVERWPSLSHSDIAEQLVAFQKESIIQRGIPQKQTIKRLSVSFPSDGDS